MGEIADMMLDGTLCEQCGVYLDGGGEGFPQLCGSCANELKGAGQLVQKTGLGTWQNVTPITRPGVKVPCPICSKSVKFDGLEAHQIAAHGETKKLGAKQLRKIL